MLFLLGLIGGAALYGTSRSTIYPRSRPTAAVDIVRDTLGVPHIFASNRRDLFLGQGYAAAADRIFQMDWSRRRLLGRQAEVLGKSNIVSDFRMRALTLEPVARELYGRLQPVEREALDAYAAGINEWLATHELPVEFRRLHYRPAAWRAIDGLVIWRGMALTLTDLTDDLDDSAERLPGGRHDGLIESENRLGSNGWAVSGARSSTGYPLLAGDPHLGYAMPGALMRGALADTGTAATGYAIPGVPGLAIGRTRHVAFTPTAFQGDAADVFHFPLVSGHENEYRTVGGFQTVTRIFPLVWLRLNRWFSLPVFWQPVEMTPYGPVLRRENGRLLVLRWAGRETIPGEGLITVHAISARNRGDIERMLRRLGLPDLNVVMADDSGEIARYAAGRLPRRAPHRGPRDGTDSMLVWSGFWTFDQMPRRVNPPEGFVASANGEPPRDLRPELPMTGTADPAWLGHDWPTARQARLETLLAHRDSLGPEDFSVLQRDHLVPGGVESTAVLLASVRGARLSAGARGVVERLDRWNGSAETDSAAPALFRVWQSLGAGAGGLETAVAWFIGRFGDDPAGWKWGRIHQAVLRHPMENLDSAWTIGPFPRPGDRGTIDVAGYPRFDTAANPPALSLHGPALRFIADLSPGGSIRGVLLAGQSGDPESPHYRDQFDLWRTGKTLVFTPSGERPDPAESTERLRP